jgi:predicted dehydrogenase
MRFGLIGTGYWAREVHARALHEHEDTTLVGVWGRDPAKAAALADAYGIVAYPEPAAMFAEVDAVSFAVPPDVQARHALEAAAAGCHLLLEKPVALDLASARAVATAVAANDVASVVFFTARFVPAVSSWLDEVRAQGGWWGARSTMLAAVLQGDGPFSSSPWRHEHGGLWDIGPHALSLVLAVLGPASRVTGVRGPRDTVQLALQHERGGASSLVLSLDAPEAARAVEFSIFGEHGWAHAPDDHGVEAVEALGNAAASLASAAASGTPHPCDVHFGVEVVEILARAQQELG